MRIVDRVAYINHDIDDAIRFGILDADDLPHAEIELLGATRLARIDTLVHDLVETSAAAGDIAQSDEIGEAMLSLRAFMFERVYLGPSTARSTSAPHASIAADLRRTSSERGDEPSEIVDFIAGMTDRFALSTPTSWTRLVARIKDASVEAVEAGGRLRRRSSRAGPRCARPARASPAAARSTRSGRRASPSTPATSSSTASAAARAAT